MKHVIDEWFKQRSDLYLYARYGDTDMIIRAANTIYAAFARGNKLLIFGNGGSATLAQHFAGELVCQFEHQRKALPAIALTADTAIITAQGNDYHFDTIFSRQIEALCKPNDVAIGMTTSDAVRGHPHSRNIRKAFIEARKQKATTIGLISTKTKELLQFIDVPLIIPFSFETAAIQEAHLSVIHLLCSLIENEITR